MKERDSTTMKSLHIIAAQKIFHEIRRTSMAKYRLNFDFRARRYSMSDATGQRLIDTGISQFIRNYGAMPIITPLCEPGQPHALPLPYLNIARRQWP